MHEPIILDYKLKKILPGQATLHSKWGWYASQQYYRREFIDMIRAQGMDIKMEAFKLELYYNTRHDCDNLAPIAKHFVDVLRELKFVANDTKKYYKSLLLEANIDLPKQSLQFKIIPLDGDKKRTKKR